MHDEASPMNPLIELANSVQDGEKVLKYRQLIFHLTLGQAWRKSLSTEFGRLAQGIRRRVKGANTICFCQAERNTPKQNARFKQYPIRV